jgi:dihydrofolate reductase
VDQQRAQVVAVVAVARNRVIGAGADIPWHVPGDQARFKRLTIGRPLPGRTTLVVSRDPSFAPAGVEVHPDVDAALDRALQLDAELVVVAGGGQVYRAAWRRLDALEVTEVDAEPPGDVFFPAIDPGEWLEAAREQHEGHAFVRFERRPARPQG